MQSIVYTLYEGHYALGVGALLNSLVNKNFDGTFVVAYRDELPEWLSKLSNSGTNEYTVGKVSVKFIQLNPPIHLRFYKSSLGISLLEKYFPEAQSLFYFDPDIVIKTNWQFFEKWVRNGIALCLDNCFGLLPDNHPWRAEWASIGTHAGFGKPAPLNFYYNGGFFGITRDKLGFLKLWRDLTTSFRELGGDVISPKSPNRQQAVVGDQDLMNAALMYTDLPVSSIGLEGMDFSGAGYVMSHAVYNIKPWKRQFTMDLVRTGNAPTLADKEFMKNIASPIPIFSPVDETLKKLDIKVASALGRVLGR